MSKSLNNSNLDRSLCLVATFVARPGQEEALKALLLGMIAPSRAEAGCIAYILHEQIGAPCVFVFYEIWADQDALDFHAKTPHFVALLAESEALLAAPITLQRLSCVA